MTMVLDQSQYQYQYRCILSVKLRKYACFFGDGLSGSQLPAFFNSFSVQLRFEWFMLNSLSVPMGAALHSCFFMIFLHSYALNLWLSDIWRFRWTEEEWNLVYEAEYYVLHAFLSTTVHAYHYYKRRLCIYVVSATILVKCGHLADRLFSSWPVEQVINVIQRCNDSYNDLKWFVMTT